MTDLPQAGRDEPAGAAGPEAAAETGERDGDLPGKEETEPLLL